MYLYSLLEVSAKTTKIVARISAAAIVVLLALIALIGFFKRNGHQKYDAKRIAFAGICVAMSFVLAFIKVSPVQYGGSITLASFVPVLIYAYVYGPVDGFAVGLIHGLLNFVEDPYILTPATFLLDYLLAFASIGIMGFFGKLRKKERAALPLILGCVCVFSARFLFHLASGMIFFLQDSVWVSFPAWATGNAFVYSFIYQCVYIPADALIATMVLVFLAKSGVLDKLIAMMRRKKRAVKTNEEAEKQNDQ